MEGRRARILELEELMNAGQFGEEELAETRRLQQEADRLKDSEIVNPVKHPTQGASTATVVAGRCTARSCGPAGTATRSGG